MLGFSERASDVWNGVVAKIRHSFVVRDAFFWPGQPLACIFSERRAE